MAQLIVTTRQSGEDAALRAMFCARKQVFIDLLKWNLPALDGRYELDQFDTARARYLILFDPDGKHLGSARLLETSDEHILGSLYPHLCADGPPRGPGTLEITRFCLDRRLSARERREVRNQLVTAIVEHALETGVMRFTGVAEMVWLQQILSFGWDCKPLGLPCLDSGRLIGALVIQITKDTPQRLATAGIWSPVATVDSSNRFATGSRS